MVTYVETENDLLWTFTHGKAYTTIKTRSFSRARRRKSSTVKGNQ